MTEQHEGSLILAAEDCDAEQFRQLHRFSSYEERIIRSLIAHGPILLRGGRGSGKSALMMEAHQRLREAGANVFSTYLSLRYLPLLRSKGEEYERIFCSLLIRSINSSLQEYGYEDITFSPLPEVGELQQALVKLSNKLKRRIVLFFDDAAHLGRETALTEFFDIFRTVSSSGVSCKAAIYPGVTKFGIRFDVYNDATVIDIARDERSSTFSSFFLDVMEARYPSLLQKLSRAIRREDIAVFLGRTVVGNMRGFIFACNKLSDASRIGLPELSSCLIYLAADYYWPLLEELTPKLGVYEPLIEPSRKLAEAMFKHAGSGKSTSVIVHRDWVQKLSKPLEILEYAGFISRREASRAMKSGGRGSRFILNFATLLETTPGARLTSDVFTSWIQDQAEEFEIHSGSTIIDIALPPLKEDVDLSILEFSVDCLAKSRAYPYGLTGSKIELLQSAGIDTVRKLAEESDENLDALPGVGIKTVQRFKHVVAQAIWM